MPTLTVEDVPSQLYETLARRASEARRSVSEEAKQILAETLHMPAESADTYGLPELIPSDEILPPCDLPLPSPARSVEFSCVAPPLPDSLVIDEQAR
ncbi:MAG: hypothetical protein NTY19_49750 [Planctomycetota bacterium]|nr:hypothetical protein [Planctomycetota bacterium]